MKWRFVDLGRFDVYNLNGISDAVFESVRDKLSEPSLTVARLKPSAVTIGVFQGANDEVDLQKCKELGIDFTRRKSGGGAEFSDAEGELQYGVIGPEEYFPNNILEASHSVSNWVINGLATLNIKAQAIGLNDIVVNGKKISGCSQLKRDGVFMQYGTILYKPDIDIMFSVLKVSKEKMANKSITNVKDGVIGISSLADVTMEQLIDAVKKGLMEGKDCEVTTLTSSESKRAKLLADTFYSSDEWKFRR
jgi:lipoate---protein ligase